MEKVIQNRLTVWKNMPDFKIKSINNAKEFLLNQLKSPFSFRVVSDDEEWTFEGDENVFRLLNRKGDLTDMFNPNLELSTDVNEVAKMLYKHRKAINEHFFSE